MIILVIAFNVAEFVLGAVVIFQFLTKLFTGEPNQQLRNLGQNLGSYLRDIVAFLTFASEEKPFPFAAWPAGEAPAPAVQGSGASGGAKRAPRRRSRASGSKGADDEGTEAGDGGGSQD